MSNHQWYPLTDFQCPAVGCIGKGTGVNWVCGKCKTQMYISQRGYMSCYDDTHFGKVSEFPWDCGNHGDHPSRKYQRADLRSFSFALAHALQLASKAGSEWVAALLLELSKQYN